MLRDKPCPDRIFDDLGGGFSMGCVMGAVFHFARGVLLSTSGEKLFGGISCLKKRAPLLAGSFAMWAGVYSISQCLLIKLRNTDDGYNKIASGFITGGVLAIRAGPRIAFKNALMGGIFLGAIVIVQIFAIRKQKQLELQVIQQFTHQEQNKVRKQLAIRRKDLFQPDGTPKLGSHRTKTLQNI